MVPCSVLLGTMNMYLVACGTFPQTLILANKSIATALSQPKIVRSNYFSPTTTRRTTPNYVTTTTTVPRTPVPVLQSTTDGPSRDVPTTSTLSPTYTTTLSPNLRHQPSRPSVSSTKTNNELTTTRIPNLGSLQQNMTQPLYTVTKIVREIQVQENFTPLWIGVALFVIFCIVMLKHNRIKCEKRKLQRKESILPDERPKNRNSWSVPTSGPTKKQKSFLREMGDPPPIPKRPVKAPASPPAGAPPPPPTVAKMRISEMSETGALEKLKHVRASRNPRRGNGKLRSQVVKLRQQQQSINVKPDT